MHDIQKIRDNSEKFAELQKRRGVKIDVEEIITLDSSKRTQMTKLQNLQNERNELSKQIGLQKGKDNSGKANELIDKVHALKDQISQLENQITLTSQRLEAILLGLPNLPFDDVPIGSDESFNIEIEAKRYGKVNNKKTAEHFEIDTVEGMICLLYTSPSPRDRQKSRMPSSA